MASSTRRRKEEHVRITLEEAVESGSTGLECVRLIHQSLPQLDMGDVDTSVEILGKKLRSPLIISAMTGGYEGARRINRELAAAAERHGVGFGLGSMRAMMEDRSLAPTFDVREVAPDTLLLGNIGIPQLRSFEFEEILEAMESIGVDAVAIHLNAVHEVSQPRGEPEFSQGLEKIREFVSQSPFPVIVKETGAGISMETAVRLERIGVRWVDVAGLGGTSFPMVESHRAAGESGRRFAESMASWGIPTAASVIEVCSKTEMKVIASGGIRSGLEVAKCISLGAVCGGMASPLLKAAEAGREKLDEYLALIGRQIRSAMFLTGSRNLQELRKARVVVTGWLREWIVDRGIEPGRFARPVEI